MTPLRQRMLDELRRRNFSEATIDVYVRAVAAFALHFRRSPEALSPDDVLTFQLHLRDVAKVAWSTYNVYTSALRFLYAVVLGKSGVVLDIPYARLPRKVPIVLSQNETRRLIEAADKIRDRAHHGGVRRRSACLRARVLDFDLIVRSRQRKRRRRGRVPLDALAHEELFALLTTLRAANADSLIQLFFRKQAHAAHRHGQAALEDETSASEVNNITRVRLEAQVTAWHQLSGGFIASVTTTVGSGTTGGVHRRRPDDEDASLQHVDTRTTFVPTMLVAASRHDPQRRPRRVRAQHDGDVFDAPRVDHSRCALRRTADGVGACDHLLARVTASDEEGAARAGVELEHRRHAIHRGRKTSERA